VLVGNESGLVEAVQSLDLSMATANHVIVDGEVEVVIASGIDELHSLFSLLEKSLIYSSTETVLLAQNGRPVFGP